MMRLLAFFLLAICVLPLPAMELSLDGVLTQGGLVRGQLAPGQQLWLDGEKITTTAQGHFVFGFGRDHAATALLRIENADGTQREHELSIAPREYQTQHIRGLPQSKVTPTEQDLKRARDDQAQVAKSRAVFSTLEGFTEDFRWPTHGTITGVYGSARILNGKPRQPHYGIDIAAEEGTPVVAPASGRVTLAHPDMFFTGATVILDHGFGISSSFLHLQKIEVDVGQMLQQGERFATVGSTGRSTGPHLDWRVNWFDTRVDPALLVGPMPEANPASP